VHNLRLIFEVISLSQIRLAVIEIHPIWNRLNSY
jgi:hypothetical protein